MENNQNNQIEKNKPKRKKKLINKSRLALIITITIYLIIEITASLKDATITKEDISYNQFETMVENNEVDSIIITKGQNTFVVNTKDGNSYSAVNPQNDTFVLDLLKRGVNVNTQKKTLFDAISDVMITLPTVILLAMMMIYISNSIIGGSTKMFTVVKPSNNNVTFDDVKGMGQTKKEVQFIVDQITNWKKLGELGARPVKGVLLYGPPGTGKTMLAKAIAKEAGVSFISASGSDFNEVFVGLGAARVRSLWDTAASNTPCILFIDEIDCLGKRRKGGDGASQDHNQTLNALLQKMDGLNEENGVLVIGATNRKDDLDKALLRPGRFDKQYFVGIPETKEDRDELVEVYLKDKKLSDDATLENVSKLMVGLSGAEVEECLNEAVYISLAEHRDGIIKLSDIDEAIMKLHMGGVKKEHIAQRDAEICAWHEAGHAIISLITNHKLSKVSIVPYSGGVGGVTMRDMDDEIDKKLKFKKEYEEEIMILLAGKNAEEIYSNSLDEKIFYGHTQGCSNDLEKATELIYSMISRFGFDDDCILSSHILLENGISSSLGDNLIDKYNKKLKELNKQTTILLEEHIVELDNFHKALLKNKTIVNPKLEDYL